MSTYAKLIKGKGGSLTAQAPFPGHESRSSENYDGGVSYDLDKARTESIRNGRLDQAATAAQQQVRRVAIYGTCANVANATASKLSDTAFTLFVSLVREDLWEVALDDCKTVYTDSLAQKMSHSLMILAWHTSIPLATAGSLEKMAKIRSYALKIVPSLRTLSHLYEWFSTHMEFSKAAAGGSKGTGKGVRKAITKWFTSRDATTLVYQSVKYKMRNGVAFSHLLSLAHIKATTAKKCKCKKLKATESCSCSDGKVITNLLSPAHQVVLAYGKHDLAHAALTLDLCIKRSVSPATDPEIKTAIKVLAYLVATVRATDASTSVEDVCALVAVFKLPREVVSTTKLGDSDVWTALLLKHTTSAYAYDASVKKLVLDLVSSSDTSIASDLLDSHFPAKAGDKGDVKSTGYVIGMPITALRRILNKLSAIGLTNPHGSPFATFLIDSLAKQLKDPMVLAKGRVHPMDMLVAWKQYSLGRGDKGSLTWTANQTLVDALEAGFTAAFRTLRGYGVPIAHGIDASGSMSGSGTVPGINCLNAATVCALMVLSFYKAERRYAHEHKSPFRQLISYFSGGWSGPPALTDITAEVSDQTTFDQMCRLVQRSDWASTDISAFIDYCSAQLRGSLQKAKSGDRAFKDVPVKNWPGYYKALCVWTDNDVNSGRNVTLALKEYIELVQECVRLYPLTEVDGKVVRTSPSKLFASLHPKMIVLATYASHFTVGDPCDPNVLGVCGCDLSVPTMISTFLFGDQ